MDLKNWKNLSGPVRSRDFRETHRQVENAMERCTVCRDAVYILYVSFLVFSGWFAPVIGLFLSLLLFAWACLLSLSEDEQKALLS